VVDPADMEGLQKALNDQHCTLFFSESPTNPYLR
jgi:cystathionine gamma-synthase